MPDSDVKGNCVSWIDSMVDPNTNVLIVTGPHAELCFVDNIIKFGTCKDLCLNHSIFVLEIGNAWFPH